MNGFHFPSVFFVPGTVLDSKCSLYIPCPREIDYHANFMGEETGTKR